MYVMGDFIRMGLLELWGMRTKHELQNSYPQSDSNSVPSTYEANALPLGNKVWIQSRG